MLEFIAGDARERLLHCGSVATSAAARASSEAAVSPKQPSRSTSLAIAPRLVSSKQCSRSSPRRADGYAAVGAGQREAGTGVRGLVDQRAVTGFDQIACSAERQQLQLKACEGRDGRMLHLPEARPMRGELRALHGRQTTQIRRERCIEPIGAGFDGCQARRFCDQEWTAADGAVAGAMSVLYRARAAAGTTIIAGDALVLGVVHWNEPPPHTPAA